MQLISSNLLPVPVPFEQNGPASGQSAQFGLKYCPSMDLIATYPQTLPVNLSIATTDQRNDKGDAYGIDDEEELLVDVFRLNGQKVFSIAIDDHGKSIGIMDVAWRDDGIILAIATSDSTVRLVNCFSGKVVHTFTTQSDRPLGSQQHSSGVRADELLPRGKRKSTARSDSSRKRQCVPTSVSYSTHFTSPNATRARLAQIHEKNMVVLDDLLSLHADVDELLKLEANLPKELANIDVEQYLPKLPTLPSNGMGDNDVFSTKTSIDAILHANKHNTRSGSTDIVAIAQSDANVHIRIFDSFEVGDVDLNHALNIPSGCILGEITKIITHPFLEKIYVIAEDQQPSSPNRRKQVRNGKANHHSLHLLSLELRFLQQSPMALPTLATKATQLHNLVRYLRQIELQLGRDVKTAFDLPMRFVRTLEEDLKEQDGDGSTFKTSAYHALLTGEVSGKFKEWLVDILGERGVKRWEKAVADCLDTVRRLVSENWNPAVERAGIVISRLTGLATSGTFTVDKPLLDYLRETVDVMAVIGEDLLREVSVEISGFAAFIAWLKREVEAAGLEDTSEKLDEMRDGSDHSEIRKVLRYISKSLQNTSVKKYIREEQAQHSMGEDLDDDLDFYKTFREKRTRAKEDFSPPSMRFLTMRLGSHCERLFDRLAQQLQQNIFAEHMCILEGLSDAKVMDCRIVSESEQSILHIYGRDLKQQGRLRRLEQTLGSDSSQTTKTMEITSEDSADIVDVKCADDIEVFLLVRTLDTMKVLSIQNFAETKTRYVFGGAQDSYAKLGLIPWKLDVNGRKTRRAMTVLDEQGRGYGVFDLDSVESDVSKDEDEVMSG